MPTKVSIEDVSTIQDSLESPLESYAFINENDPLDMLEFSIGIERGGITRYSESPLLKINLRKDMIPLLQKHEWALVPSDAILRRVKELFFLNHENAPCHRLSFLDVIPFQEEYEYRLFCLNVKETPPLYIQGKRYEYPFNKLPPVRATLHPCFTIPSAINFYERNFDVLDTSSRVDRTEALCQEISLGLNRHLFLSWVRSVSTKVLGRPVPSARRDLPDSKPIVYSKVYKGFGQKQAKKAGKRKRKLSDSTTTSPEDDAPPPKRRSPRVT